MKKFLLCLIACAPFLSQYGVAEEGTLPDPSTFPALANCTQITKKVGIKTSGRMGWKPNAAHFNTAVIVGPRLYNFPPSQFVPVARIFSATDGRRLFGRLHLKSNDPGCTHVGESFCAATWITPNTWTGQKIKNRYGSVYVRLSHPRGCRYYFVADPSKRVQYANQ
ncbi:MAG: hypothetical protein EBZ48_00975 [Proteobacteria bacterium]|nr:hypothetical protein [Pseudomonadota bacterium]